MRKAFAYLRVSGKGQVRGDGFARQSEAVRDYAKAHGIRIIRTFREAGVSGTKELENRPALSGMMEAPRKLKNPCGRAGAEPRWRRVAVRAGHQLGSLPDAADCSRGFDHGDEAG